MVGSVPPPTVPGQPQAPIPASETPEGAEVNTDGHAQGTPVVVQADGKAPIPDAKGIGIGDVEGGFEKKEGGGDKGLSPEPPPNLKAEDKARWDNGLRLAGGMKAEGAVAKMAAEFKDMPITDVNEFFKTLDSKLSEMGAVPPHPEFNKIEAKELGLNNNNLGLRMGGGGSNPAVTDARSGDLRMGSAGGTNGPDTGLRAGSGGPGFNPGNNFAETVKTQTWAVLGSMNGQDIEAIAFLVLMQAAKSSQEDLKAIMAQVKAINNAKSKQRELLATQQQLVSKFADKTGSQIVAGQNGVPSSGPMTTNGAVVDAGNASNPQGFQEVPKYVTTPGRSDKKLTKAELDATVDKMKGDLDSMSEMGEMESLRLQMAMDRMSKMMSTLSNLLKKISDTANSITQNLK